MEQNRKEGNYSKVGTCPAQRLDFVPEHRSFFQQNKQHIMERNRIKCNRMFKKKLILTQLYWYYLKSTV